MPRPTAPWVATFLTANPSIAESLCQHGTDCNDCAQRVYESAPYSIRGHDFYTGGSDSPAYGHCGVCGFTVVSNTLRRVYDNTRGTSDRVCAACYVLYGVCPSCGDNSLLSEMTPAPESGTRWCRTCYDSHTGDCEVCGSPGERRYYDEEEGARFFCSVHVQDVWHCDDCGYWNLPAVQSCGCSQDDRTGPAVAGYHDGPAGGTRYFALVKQEVTRVLPKDDDRRLFLGAELEIECTGAVARTTLARRLQKVMESWCERDGSLSSNGFEWITQPHTFAALSSLRAEVGEAFAEVRAGGGRSYHTTTCGLHIHASRSAFQGTAHIFKLLALVYYNPNTILKLSQRPSIGAMEQYAMLDESIAKLPKKAKSGPDAWHRYCAINLNNEHTVEFRFFKGTLNPASFYRAIEFVDAAIEWTRNVTLEDARSFRVFREYVNKFAKRYPELAKWFADPQREPRDA